MNRGFSLVELSIVLVILGLLTGGILAGQSLIKAAELRAISTEYARWETAVSTFRDKYVAIPGDMATATKFWGPAPTCPGDTTTPATDLRTCNGDGNGLLDLGGTGPESTRFWQHLANAGLIEGRYTGVSSDADGYAFGVVAPINVPQSRFANAEWVPYAIGNIDYTNTSYFEGNYGNAFEIGLFHSILTSNGNILIPEDAWNIDTKMDDGKPATGSIRTLEANGVNCNTIAASTTTPATLAAYNLSYRSIACLLIFTNSI